MAVTALSVTKVAEWNVAGGLMQCYTATLDPESCAARGEIISVVPLTGARPGDLVWANGEDPDVMLEISGAKAITDVVSLYLGNNYDLTTAVDAATFTLNLQILKRTIVTS